MAAAYLRPMEKHSLIANEVKAVLEGEGSGHDWWHIHRVRNNAMAIADNEEANLEVVELAALLHDIADHKFHDGDLAIGPNRAEQLLLKHGYTKEVAQQVKQIIAEVSYKGAEEETPVSSIEAACVQDGDRLDAIGAIGIGRAFAFGGNKNRLMFDPNHPPKMHADFEAYRTDKGSTINHFYEKLLLLKDRMQTEAGKKMAEERHRVMEDFLKQFYTEWGI
ncbi:MAG: hypothetical protein ACJAU0_001951 [Flavobacteriales bacterium]|jgi:uncharacterized protein